MIMGWCVLGAFKAHETFIHILGPCPDRILGPAVVLVWEKAFVVFYVEGWKLMVLLFLSLLVLTKLSE